MPEVPSAGVPTAPLPISPLCRDADYASGFRSEKRVSVPCCQEGVRQGSRGPGGIRTHDSRIRSPRSFGPADNIRCTISAFGA